MKSENNDWRKKYCIIKLASPCIVTACTPWSNTHHNMNDGWSAKPHTYESSLIPHRVADKKRLFVFWKRVGILGWILTNILSETDFE